MTSALPLGRPFQRLPSAKFEEAHKPSPEPIYIKTMPIAEPISSEPEFQGSNHPTKINVTLSDQEYGQPVQIGETVKPQEFMAAAEVDTSVTEPIVQEFYREKIVEEFQPVVERDVFKTEIKPVIQRVHEEATMPVEVVRQTLPTEERSIYESAPMSSTASSAPVLPSSSSETLLPTIEKVVHEPVVIERVHPTIREEIHPVVERDVNIPRTVVVTKKVHEDIMEAPVYDPIEIRGPESAHSADASTPFGQGQDSSDCSEASSVTSATSHTATKKEKGFKKFLHKITGHHG